MKVCPLRGITNASLSRLFVISGLSFADPSITASNFTQYVQGFVPTASKALVQQLVDLYPESDYDSDYLRTQSINQDPIFLCSSYALANAFGDKAFKMVWDVLPAYHGQDASMSNACLFDK